jgi:hypothetical protein
MVKTAKGDVMNHAIPRLVGGTVVLLAVAAIAVPTVGASGRLDPWQQNLYARHKYAQMTDPWARNLLARQAHRYHSPTVGQGVVGTAGGRAIGAGAEITTGFASPGAPGTSAVEVGSNGFDWGDAGIGAAGALGVVLLGAGTTIALRRSGALTHTHL